MTWLAMHWRHARLVWRAAWLFVRSGDDTQLQIAVWLVCGEREARRS